MSKEAVGVIVQPGGFEVSYHWHTKLIVQLQNEKKKFHTNKLKRHGDTIIPTTQQRKNSGHVLYFRSFDLTTTTTTMMMMMMMMMIMMMMIMNMMMMMMMMMAMMMWRINISSCHQHIFLKTYTPIHYWEHDQKHCVCRRQTLQKKTTQMPFTFSLANSKYGLTAVTCYAIVQIGKQSVEI